MPDVATVERHSALPHTIYIGEARSTQGLSLVDRHYRSIPHDLLSSDSETVFSALNIISNVFPVLEAAIELNRFVRENQSEVGVRLSSAACETMLEVLERRRDETGWQLLLNTEENNALVIFFDSLKEKLPQIKKLGVEERLYSALVRMINFDSDISNMVESLVSKIHESPAEALIQAIADHAPDISVHDVAEIVNAGRAGETTTAIDRYSFLSSLFADLPEQEAQKIISDLDRFVKGPDTLGYRLLKSIFYYHSSKNLAESLRLIGIDPKNLSKVLNNESILSLVSIMLDNPKKYRFQLGLLLSQIPLTNIPEEIRIKLKPFLSNMEMTIKSNHDLWFLCEEAEPLLDYAMRKKAVMLINENLLVKFSGRLSALCLHTFTTSMGQTFIEGNWYSPTDSNSRRAIKDAFDDGKTKISLQGSEWAIMRPLFNYRKKTSEKFLEHARRFAEELPDKLPLTINGRTRKDFRELEEAKY